MLRFRCTLLCASALSLVLSACGGGGGGGKSSGGITPANAAPVIQASLVLDEDTTVTSTLITDPEGNSFTVTVVTPPAHGTLQPDALNSGRFGYTPNPNFNGSDSVTLTAVDSGSASSTRTLAITVRAVNDPPVAVADSMRTMAGQSVRLDVLGNDSDIDGDVLTTTVMTPPASGTATVNADGSIQYSPGAVGNISLEYQVRDSAGVTAHATLSIAVGFASGIVYLSRSSYSTPQEVYFADGMRRFKVNAPLQAGETVLSVQPAKTASVVFYRTNQNVYRVELHHPGVAQPLASSPMTIGEFAINDAGSTVAFAEGTRLKFIDYSQSDQARDLAGGQRGLFMSRSGYRVYYAGLITSSAAGALFYVDISAPGKSVQITPTLTPPDSIHDVLYRSRDEHRLYYTATVNSGATQQIIGLDPDVSGSAFLVEQGSLLPFGWAGVTQDESTYWGPAAPGPRPDYYAARIGSPGTAVNLTAGTPNGGIHGAAMVADGSRFYYARSDASWTAGRLYRVDTANPSVSVPIGAVPAAHYGVHTFSLANNEQNIVYTTLDLVPGPGGSFVLGGSDLVVMNLSAPNSPQVAKHFPGRAEMSIRAPDDSFVLVTATPQLGGTPTDIFALNMNDTSQLIQLSTEISEQPQLVPNF
jgi:hypothetical protein